MTALAKLLAMLVLVAGMAMVSWAAGLFLHRPGWYAPSPEAVDKGHTPVTFKGLQAEIDALNKSALVASRSWGESLEALKDRERFREYRRAWYKQRIAWAKTGNPDDPVVEGSPLNKGFYEPNVVDLKIVRDDLAVYKAKLKPLEDRVTAAKKRLDDAEQRDPPNPSDVARARTDLQQAELAAAPLRRLVDELDLTVKMFPLVSTLYDMRLDPVTGLPRGKPVLAVDGSPLPGAEKLLDSITADVAEINRINALIVKIRKGEKELKTERDFREADGYTKAEDYKKLGDGQLIKYMRALELRAGKMRDIRDTIQNELFYLSTYEVNVYETRETVLRRERQLRKRLLSLGIIDP